MKTKLVPVVAEDGSNSDIFVSHLEFEQEIQGIAILTAPLRFDIDIDLIGVSTSGPLTTAGYIDHTDAVLPDVIIDTLYFEKGTEREVVSAMYRKKLSSENGRSTFSSEIECDGKKYRIIVNVNINHMTGGFMVECEMEDSVFITPLGFTIDAYRGKKTSPSQRNDLSRSVVIGIKNSGVDNIFQLPPRMTVMDNDVIIHHNPMVRIQGNEFLCNCDIVVHLCNPGEEFDHVLEGALGDNYHFIPRLEKSIQHAKLLAAKKRSSDDVFKALAIPRLLASSHTSHDGSCMETGIDRIGSSFGPSVGSTINKVVVKPENGAKGKGQAVVPIDLLRSFFSDIEKPLLELKEKYPDVFFSSPDLNGQSVEPDDDDAKLSGLGSWTISEYVENIAEEYRILVTGDRFMVLTRQRSKDQYPQANLDLDVHFETRRLSDITEDDPTHSIVKGIVETFNLRLGSIDLYKTTTGQYGFFECCPQFGLKSLSHLQAAEVHIDFVKWLVESYMFQN